MAMNDVSPNVRKHIEFLLAHRDQLQNQPASWVRGYL